MARLTSVFGFVASVMFFGLIGSGCQAVGVGDPCTPENIPADGFKDTEAYLETSSVQCRTRICIVYKLEGDPSCTKEGCAPTDTACQMRCASKAQIDDSVYCTCRCDGPAGSAQFCKCAAGYECQPVITSDTAGAGIEGSYCVKPKS